MNTGYHSYNAFLFVLKNGRIDAFYQANFIHLTVVLNQYCVKIYLHNVFITMCYHKKRIKLFSKNGKMFFVDEAKFGR